MARAIGPQVDGCVAGACVIEARFRNRYDHLALSELRQPHRELSDRDDLPGLDRQGCHDSRFVGAQFGVGELIVRDV